MGAIEVILKDGRRVSIRPFEVYDKYHLLTFYSSLSEEVLRWALPPYSPERVEGWMRSQDQNIIIVAMQEKRLVGNLIIFQTPSPRMKGIGELIIYLHQDFLNVGLGTSMMKNGLEAARQRSLHRLSLGVIADNKNAIHVYEKVGFVVEGTRKDGYFGADGSYHDMVEMGIVL